jgi:hypothetical protein
MLLCGAFLLPTAAVAEPLHGLYVGGDVGANFLGTLTSSGSTTDIGTDVGPVGMASVGWAFANGLRVEIEGSERSNGIDDVATLRANGLTVPLTNAGGDADTSAVMANIAYDIPVGSMGLPIQPYVGAGIGYAWLDLGNVHGNGVSRFSVPGNNTVVSPDLVSFGSAGAFAYQAFAGVSLPISGLPGLEATVEYRFLGTARADIPVNRVSTAAGDLVNGVTASSSARNGFVLQDSSVLVGLRYSFGFL